MLDDLPGGSLLECCFFLGKLREPTYELAKAAKNDSMMKVGLRGRSTAAWCFKGTVWRARGSTGSARAVFASC